MPITVQWDTPDKTIVRFSVRGSWQPADAWDAIHDAEALLQEVDYVPDVINDIRRMGSAPSNNIDFWREVWQWAKERQLHETAIVLVGANFLMRMAFQSAKRLNVSLFERTFLADSPLSARRQLREYRQQHPRTLQRDTDTSV